ncbi:unnamed protein product [Caenorhabditis brenneri]
MSSSLPSDFCFGTDNNTEPCVSSRQWSDVVRDQCRKETKVYTDGSCHNQGQPNATAGFGVFWGDLHPYNHSGRVDGLQDNNRAELTAAHYAIRQAIAYKFSAITIVTDSEFVRMVIERPEDFYRIAYKNYHDLIFSIHAMRKQIDVSVEQVKSHAGNHGNEEADWLANISAYPEDVDILTRSLTRTRSQRRRSGRRRSRSQGRPS